MCKAGAYDGQSLKTIVRTKLTDLEKHVTYEALTSTGEPMEANEDSSAPAICFWSFKGSNKFLELVRDLGEKDLEADSDDLKPFFMEKVVATSLCL